MPACTTDEGKKATACRAPWSKASVRYLPMPRALVLPPCHMPGSTSGSWLTDGAQASTPRVVYARTAHSQQASAALARSNAPTVLWSPDRASASSGHTGRASDARVGAGESEQGLAARSRGAQGLEELDLVSRELAAPESLPLGKLSGNKELENQRAALNGKVGAEASIGPRRESLQIDTDLHSLSSENILQKV